MKKSKSKRSKSRDRLSDLPDSLVFEIFWFLPMRDVVRTTTLSKRWKDLWTNLPFLNFEDFMPEDSDDSTSEDFDDYTEVVAEIVADFVNQALGSWRETRILKFKINFTSPYFRVFDNDFEGNLNEWIRFATEKGAEEIYLHVISMYERYDLPLCLYSCSSLRVLVLSINDVRLSRIHGGVKWDRLKSLTVDSRYFGVGPCWISQVLSGSPNLEVFVLSLGKIESLCIRSSSLKKLSIHKYVDQRYGGLIIETPNLERLQLSGFAYGGDCWLNASSSLNDVTLRFQYAAWYECYETMRQIFPTIQHVERITLSRCCIEVLRDMQRKKLLSSFSKRASWRRYLYD